jgi:RHS repeat-associated protein
VANVIFATDYYAFGSPVPGRSFNLTAYRYGFNGMELDNEISGGGANYYTQWRPYDPRIGRWWSVDRLAEKFPWWTPYQFAGNIPTRFVDIDGLEPAEPGSAPNQTETAPDHSSQDSKEYAWTWYENEKTWQKGTEVAKVEAQMPPPSDNRYGYNAIFEKRAPFIAEHILSRSGPVQEGDPISKYTRTQVTNVARALYSKASGPLGSFAESQDDSNIPPQYFEQALVQLIGDSEGMRTNTYWAPQSGALVPVPIEDIFAGFGLAKLGVKSVRALVLNRAKTVANTGNIGSLLFKHNHKYADRVRKRALEDPVSHNFPYSFDDIVLQGKVFPKKNGYTIYQKRGTMNGREGVFEIGVTKDGVIDHRFFRPDK